MTTTLVGTPDPDDVGWLRRRVERLDWLASTLANHVARIEWLIRTARDNGAGREVVWDLEGSLELTKAALRGLAG
jgi:hypothetical protein